jgi:predicted TIM-barrel fold metal-dependent hydrolase
MKLRSAARCLVRFAALVTIAGGILIAPGAQAQSRGEWIDVHFHLVADKNDLESFDEAAQMALRTMEAENIRTIIIMSPPRPKENFDIESIEAVAKKYAPRIVMSGGGGSLNPMLQAAGHAPQVTEEMRRAFEETTQHIIASGAKGFGEIAAHHVSLSPSHGYESVPADHPLLLRLADIAADHDMPIDLHFDPIPEDVERPSDLSSPQNPPVLKENISGLERLLAHNRKAKIVWAHAGGDRVGFFKPKLAREMLSRHDNLFFSVRPTLNRNESMVPPGAPINKEWIAVLRDFPDRFVIGSDTFVVPNRYTGPEAPCIFASRADVQLRGIRRLLSHLPADLARKIGYENAERLYRLNR